MGPNPLQGSGPSKGYGRQFLPWSFLGLVEEPGRYRNNWSTQVVLDPRNSISSAKVDHRISVCEIGCGGVCYSPAVHLWHHRNLAGTES